MVGPPFSDAMVSEWMDLVYFYGNFLVGVVDGPVQTRTEKS